MKILVVEDEIKTRNGLKKLISSLDQQYNVDTAEDATIALQMCKETDYTVIFTDIQMPGMSGLDFIDHLENYKGFIVIVSGYSDFNYARSAISKGVIGYLLKPINLSEIKEIMQKIEEVSGFNKNTKESIIVKTIKEYIHENYQHSLTLNDLAEIAFVHPTYISKIFKKETSKNVTDYIIEYRVEMSKSYLLQVEHKIYEVAHLCGFKDSKYFTSVFKNQVGITPTEYRNKNS